MALSDKLIVITKKDDEKIKWMINCHTLLSNIIMNNIIWKLFLSKGLLLIIPKRYKLLECIHKRHYSGFM
jgi:hypothetical protein